MARQDPAGDAEVLALTELPAEARLRVRIDRASDAPTIAATARAGAGLAVGDRVRLSLRAEQIAVLAPSEVAAGAIVRDGRVLLARRTSPPELAGQWELPGGKLEPGESPRQGLARELAEELGVRAQVGAQVGADVSLPEDMVLRAYAVRLERGSPEPEAREHSALRWVGPAELAATGLDATGLAATESAAPEQAGEDGGALALVANDRAWIPDLIALLGGGQPGE